MLLKELKAAYGSVWSQVGILISGIAAFNFSVRVLHQELSILIGSIVSSYRLVFHGIFDFFFSWLPFSFSDVFKDGVVLWMAAGGACFRTMLAESAKDNPLARTSYTVTYSAFLAFLLTPLMVVGYLLVEKKVYRTPSGFAVSWSRKTFSDPSYEYLYDTRVVFGLQLAAVAAVVAVMSIANAVTVQS